jgi:hypothetical protein
MTMSTEQDVLEIGDEIMKVVVAMYAKGHKPAVIAAVLLTLGDRISKKGIPFTERKPN